PVLCRGDDARLVLAVEGDRVGDGGDRGGSPVQDSSAVSPAADRRKPAGVARRDGGREIGCAGTTEG
ncbi:hypothetical protein ABZ260_42550, partial [Streptosporangium sp. NPDC006013]|uniref:hypothetical protein n=1 Tax=Streptosporangium sp. NPDC006013 TaxID=3155596 RepID=UPI00339E8921